MSRHYFKINDFELVKAMFEDNYTIYTKGLGPFGETTGEVTSFDPDDAEFDTDFIRDQFGDEIQKLSKDDQEFIDETCSLSYSDAKSMFPTLDRTYDIDDGIVVFNTEIGQCSQNFLQWDRCIDDIYCDEDDYEEFLEDHEAFQTIEWHVKQLEKYMEEHNISVEEFQQNIKAAQPKTYFFIDEIRDHSGDVVQIGEVRTTHDEIMQDFAKLMKERGFTDWDGLKGCYFDQENDTDYVVRELKVPLS